MKDLSKRIYEASKGILAEIGCHKAETRQEQRFMTAYQIGAELKKNNPPLYHDIVDECGGDYVGKGAGSNVGPAQKIAQVLGHRSDVETQYLATQDLLIEGKEPSGRDCGIFRLR